MNLMKHILANTAPKDTKTANKLRGLVETVKKEKIKISDDIILLGEGKYYLNCLPVIPQGRDILKKAKSITPIRINWKQKQFESVDDAVKTLKLQYAWNITIVDEEHTRNNFKNKENVWVVFDTEAKALQYLKVFNDMFRTAIEQDAIDEYKHFKQSPEKRPLTYDKLVDNAYELYAQVDRGEL